MTIPTAAKETLLLGGCTCWDIVRLVHVVGSRAWSCKIRIALPSLMQHLCQASVVLDGRVHGLFAVLLAGIFLAEELDKLVTVGREETNGESDLRLSGADACISRSLDGHLTSRECTIEWSLCGRV